MFQTTRRRLCEKINSCRQSQVLPFHDILDPQMVDDALDQEGVKFRQRLYTPLVTLSLFLSQVLDPDHSCRAAVARLIAWLSINDHPACAAETGSYTEARQRLPLAVIQRLVRKTAQEIDARGHETWLWNGRSIVLVDGTTASMPDTPKNQQTFPQSRTQAPGLGFPIVRIVALISLATGVVRDLATGPYRGKETGETALFRSLMNGLKPGEIVVGDRGFASFFALADLLNRGVDSVFRMHQGRKVDFRRGRRLGIKDHVVIWTKPNRPEWMDESTHARLSQDLKVRELRIKIDYPGYRVQELTLATTLLDSQAYSKEDLADLYLDRWSMELDLRSIKEVLGMKVLRCKTPEMVKKEIWMHMLAYNLIRGVMATAAAAQAHDKRPRELSFKGTLQTMTAFQDLLRMAKPNQRAELVERMLKAIASHRVGNRPGRVEPRANKRRPKKQRYLTEPRVNVRNRLLRNKIG